MYHILSLHNRNLIDPKLIFQQKGRAWKQKRLNENLSQTCDSKKLKGQQIQYFV